MSKVITFSRAFPANHPRKGEPTHFVEQIHNSVVYGTPTPDLFKKLNPGLDVRMLQDFQRLLNGDITNKKAHTIRKGNRWKVGDKFSPRVWSGKPYQSKQIVIAEDIEIKKVWDFKITTDDDDGENDWTVVDFLGTQYTCYGYGGYDNAVIETIANNDGLSLNDFYDWLIKGRTKQQRIYGEASVFDGQIICWDESINY